MSAVSNYFESLVSRFGAGWNRFWFTPADPSLVSLLRILVGLMACWWLLSFTGDLTIWFGPNGMLPPDMVQQLTQVEGWNGRWTYLNQLDENSLLYAAHGIAVLVAVAMTAGLASRITTILTLIIVLSYVHRGPLLTGQFEPVLTALLFYLCFAPCGRRFSVDRWLRDRKAQASATSWNQPSLAANVCQRLMQVHIAGFYAMMGLTKLAGGEAWWGGDAMWWLIAHPESRILDLTFLHRYEFLINFWTYLVVLFELTFAVLAWKRLARPLLLALAVLHWISLGLVTGLLSFALVMIVASVSFVPADLFAEWLAARRAPRGQFVPAGSV